MYTTLGNNSDHDARRAAAADTMKSAQSFSLVMPNCQAKYIYLYYWHTSIAMESSHRYDKINLLTSSLRAKLFSMTTKNILKVHTERPDNLITYGFVTESSALINSSYDALKTRAVC